jgi:hypothetical protein
MSYLIVKTLDIDRSFTKRIDRHTWNKHFLPFYPFFNILSEMYEEWMVISIIVSTYYCLSDLNLNLIDSLFSWIQNDCSSSL